MMWGHGMIGWGWMVMLVWWALVFGGVLWLVRSIATDGTRSARRILDERFAAGDVSAEEYQERRGLLR